MHIKMITYLRAWITTLATLIYRDFNIYSHVDFPTGVQDEP